MFNSKTVFIIGAGASAEVNMPVGSELKEKIAKRLDFSKGQPDEDIGDRFIWDAFEKLVALKGDQSSTIIDYRKSATQIKEGMNTASSIDTYLDTYKNNSKMAVCGKLAIIRSILKAERGSKLFYDVSKTNNLDFSKIKDTWYMHFFNTLTIASTKNKEHEIFENVSFIIFNYDRCFEHFLFCALMNHFQMPPVEAMKLVESVKIFHPYGTVGPKPFPSEIAGKDCVPFGSSERGNILELSNNLKTFTEQMTDQELLSDMHELINQADKVVFLGFAFHDQNLNLLQSPRSLQTKKILASAYGISDSDCYFLSNKLLGMFGGNMESRPIHEQLRKKYRCSQIFTEYSRLLSS